MRKLAALGAALSLVVACGPSGPARAALPTQLTAALSNAALAHLNNILRLMQANSIRRLTIGWTAIRTGC